MKTLHVDPAERDRASLVIEELEKFGTRSRLQLVATARRWGMA